MLTLSRLSASPLLRAPTRAAVQSLSTVTNAATADVQSSSAAIDSVNQNVVRAEYAVRGPILDEAMRLREQLAADPTSLPFDKIVACNIGNPQALGQKPISFSREVLALVACPSLLAKAKSLGFADDVVARAEKYLAAVAPASGLGAYTDSQGIAAVRQEVADFIEARDGHSSDPSNIFLTDGASMGVKNVMQLLLRTPSSGFRDGVLCPIPQYPLYSATCAMLEAQLVPYYLDERNGWGLSADELRRSLAQAKSEGTSVRGLVVINPGNPTGQTLEEPNMRSIIELCADEGLVLCADEVYQENIWDTSKPFHSFKKVACDMGFADDPASALKLVSFHSTSKGFLGECGLRGGFFELHGFDSALSQQLYKLASVCLCSNTIGQLSTGLMVNPPKEGDASFPRYKAERDETLASLKRRATRLTEALQTLEGVTCNPSDGAMYAFPQITLPEGAVAAAARASVPADELYCMELLKATGIVVVPGSGFGQVDGTWHFRTTFLPPEDEMDAVAGRLKQFHGEFLQRYK
jgi:alanine transaminase